MKKKKIIITNKLGLHANPCSQIVKLASKFDAKFEIKTGSTTVNGKSILGLLTMAAAKGTELLLIADGEGEDFLIEEMSYLFKSNFGED